MKLTQQLIVASLFAITGAAAVAQEMTPDTWMNTGASTSREQVKAELAQARADGSIRFTAANYDFVAAIKPTKSREQVRAEAAAAVASGEWHAMNSEVYGFEQPRRTPVYAKSSSNAAQ